MHSEEESFDFDFPKKIVQKLDVVVVIEEEVVTKLVFEELVVDFVLDIEENEVVEESIEFVVVIVAMVVVEELQLMKN